MLCCAAAAVTSQADVRLPSLFSDHMVLQRNMADPIWGWADPGERISVRFAGHTVKTKANDSGQWRVKLPAMNASAHGRDLVVRGKNQKTIHDVLVGEVWLCSGQSNMEFPIKGWTHPFDVDQVIATANHPTIRLIDAPNVGASAPRNHFTGHWLVSSPETVAHFSAAGYFFARSIQKRLGVPVGLLEADYGGTAIEPWIPEVGYRQTPQLKHDYQHLQQLQSQWSKARQSYSKQGDKIPTPVTRVQLPTVLFNGMVAPFVGYGMRGALWYQGEHNVRWQTKTYFYDLKALIGGWRHLWKEGDFPLIIAQIAPYGGYKHPQAEPFIWEGETEAAKKLKNVGIAGTMDIGNLDNIHPKDKQDVGKRLALWALAKVYGKSGFVYSGPIFKSMDVQDNKAIIHFSHVGSGLASRDGKPLHWFEIAGHNGRFVNAYAAIEGNTVVVHVPSVQHPAAVRFGWANIAEPNLTNKAGLPALPFRTSKTDE
jgi:sialate O-acetylesterase